MTDEASVLRLADIDRQSIAALIEQFGLRLVSVADGDPIPGSFWGESEAGLRGEAVFARSDTPVHSLMHEFCHVLCMPPKRRAELDTDASDSLAEEDATCYLQILLADQIPGMGRQRMLADMDAWGYSFRLGSSKLWFEQDAEDARCWLLEQRLIDDAGRVTMGLRT